VFQDGSVKTILAKSDLSLRYGDSFNLKLPASRRRFKVSIL
jgi:hypothetical protein